MKIGNEHMAAVVTDASKRMQNPDFSAGIVGEFVVGQPAISQYVSASEGELGGAEGVLAVIFHAGLLAAAIERALGMPCPTAGFEDLDRATQGDPKKILKQTQPALYEFIASNIDDKARQRMLCLAGVALTLPLADL